MSDYLIDDGMEVTLHFTLKLEDGTLVDSTKDKAPATFEFGDGNLPPGFEHPIKGMSAGQEATFQITPEHAFGQHNPQNIQTLKRADFGDEVPEIGMVMSFADKAGTELPGVVKTIDGERIEVDFNHPLAGRTLVFEVEVLDVKPVTTH
ncbi:MULTISPECIES: FKBP-type peptidyl-prolyl cis-trans isomerase [unclassified Halomonas]|uniref:FKBP-type peptidyl-prolyl cis-trans isomerase n=1 Tax=unclassified Halomonas TaxID=2609666 RepID=UPI0007D98E03|nr:MULTISPECIES: FKBP-type peptidyl-prolyl cis-trans isomerase [unclassified Halomonas]MBT2785987.1 FKBP-type peptidyl-prolyl cis-trans isomerase [Halomonas sp. ISL-106]MBT2797009.1 FKBP-type peptidyl-prolyl cis-trans isomerase [Halomonas sp. ISL-104]MDQ7729114.1 FKBP-type peptidyl-prolyl cis-trans isomerase [Halomonas sp. SpR8]OAL58397.1 peptidylprolyl isomerase [Halomonas sp. ALS9]